MSESTSSSSTSRPHGPPFYKKGERRSSLRRKTIIPVILKVQHKRHAGITCAGTILNICRDGCLLSLTKEGTLNEVILLDHDDSRVMFEVPPKSKTVITGCDVCRIFKLPEAIFLGVRFRELLSDSRHAIGEYVDGKKNVRQEIEHSAV
jgi:hypothetical protein